MDTPLEKAFTLIGAEITEGLGAKCADFNPGCLTCATWRAFNDLSRSLYIIEEAARPEMNLADAHWSGK